MSIMILIPDEQMAFKTKQQKDQLKEKPKERKRAEKSLRIVADTCRAHMSPISETEPANQAEDQTVTQANKQKKSRLQYVHLALFVSFPTLT